MNVAVRVLDILIRAFGAAALVLGLAFWLGYARSLTQLHIGLGIGVVLCLWAVAWVAWRNRRRRGLAAFAVACGVINWVFGLTQSTALPGAFHGVVEVAHLGLGVITIGVGVTLATAVSHRRVSAESS
jgi:hypothetical protein